MLRLRRIKFCCKPSTFSSNCSPTVLSNKVVNRFYEFERLPGVEDNTRPPQLTLNFDDEWFSVSCDGLVVSPDGTLSMHNKLFIIYSSKKGLIVKNFTITILLTKTIYYYYQWHIKGDQPTILCSSLARQKSAMIIGGKRGNKACLIL